MNSLPPTISASQLSAAIERIEALAQPRAADDMIARKIWNECRRLRAQAEVNEQIEHREVA